MMMGGIIIGIGLTIYDHTAQRCETGGMSREKTNKGMLGLPKGTVGYIAPIPFVLMAEMSRSEAKTHLKRAIMYYNNSLKDVQEK